eukprot:GHVU01172943.1.p1 GENE.GHVU01172943.1~~GHVU01172943.1.p1  ORF type:complete len:114 (-),score=7.67 GHVU01172943.1:697-1038(-)
MMDDRGMKPGEDHVTIVVETHVKRPSGKSLDSRISHAKDRGQRSHESNYSIAYALLFLVLSACFIHSDAAALRILTDIFEAELEKASIGLQSASFGPDAFTATFKTKVTLSFH